jgi:hypothetical protein
LWSEIAQKWKQTNQTDRKIDAHCPTAMNGDSAAGCWLERPVILNFPANELFLELLG